MLDDDALTETTVEVDGGGRVAIVACGALAHEIIALKRLNGWDHMSVHCLPAILHNHPERIPAAVEKAVADKLAEGARVFVAYADCGTGGRLSATCGRLGVEMIAGPHCYSFFSGVEAFAQIAESEITTFYLTDFLARQFDAFVTKPLGLDRHPELRDAYFGHYEKVVHLAQTDDEALSEKARAAARKLGLAFERRFTGYGDLAAALARAGD